MWEGVPDVTTDDIGFTSNILDDLEAQYCIDTNRIYATGKSQGGGFVGVLACDEDMSKRIAAFSPVSGAFYISDYGDECVPETVSIPCNPGRGNIPILDFHGMADTTIKYYGGTRKGGCLPTIPHWVQSWAERNELWLHNHTSTVPGTDEDSAAVMYQFGRWWKKGLVTHIMDGTVSERERHDTRCDITCWTWTDRRKDRQAGLAVVRLDLGVKQTADGCLRIGHRTRLAKHRVQQRQLAIGPWSCHVQRIIADRRLLQQLYSIRGAVMNMLIESKTSPPPPLPLERNKTDPTVRDGV